MAKFSTILLVVSLMVLQKAMADYELQITVHSFTLVESRCVECNFENMTLMNEICDSAPNDSCDIRFNICQREIATLSDNSDCPENKTQTPMTIFNVVPLVPYNFSAGELFLGLTNPIIYSGFRWLGVQFYMETGDQDFEDPDDLIDTLAVDVDIPVGASISCTTYTGRFNNTQVELSFRVVCAENYYGHDCARYCNNNSCPCDPGYTGEFCETNINKLRDCENACSNNGNCVPQIVDTYTCICMPGYTGEMCEVIIGIGCDANNCSGNGECNFMSDSSGRVLYKCVCVPGFSGTYCEQEVSITSVPTQTVNSPSSIVIGSIIGGILGAIFLIIVAIVTITAVITLIKLPRRKQTETRPHLQVDSVPLTVNGVGDNPVYDAPENGNTVTVDTQYFKVKTKMPLYQNLPPRSPEGHDFTNATNNTRTIRGEHTPAATIHTHSEHHGTVRWENDETEREFKNPIYGTDP